MWTVIRDGWSYVVHTPLIRGLVVGITGAFAAGGVVIGLARVYVADLGGGDPGYGLLFARGVRRARPRHVARAAVPARRCRGRGCSASR